MNALQCVQRINQVIAERVANPDRFPTSVTADLAIGGCQSIVPKLIEEVCELGQAIVVQEDEQVLQESQQVLYVASVGLATRRTSLMRAYKAFKVTKPPSVDEATCNQVIKQLGQAAGNFAVNMCLDLQSNELNLAGAVLIGAVDQAVQFRNLNLAQVLERI